VKGTSHVALGACTALALHLMQPYLPSELPALGLALAASGLGSLLPDIDSGEAMVRQLTGTARGGGCLGWAVSLGMHALGGHRALTHTVFVAALLAYAASTLHRPWLIAFAAGYIAHIAADMLTRGGVSLFWPLSRQRIHWLPRGLTFRTGSWPEVLIVLAVLEATAYAYAAPVIGAPGLFTSWHR